MNSLRLTARGALALSLALTAIAAAQEPQQPNDTTPADLLPTRSPTNPPEAPSRGVATPSSPLGVAEAKKRYGATQERLQNLVKGGAPQLSQKTVAVFLKAQKPHDRLRAAVAEDFDARRQLQQAELAELEARVARIKHALEIRDAMRETLIDQRTDELLEQMEDGGKGGNRGPSVTPGSGHPRHPDATNSAAPPRVRDTDLKPQALHLKGEVVDAKTSFDLAKRTHGRALKLFKSGAISKDVLDQFQGDLEMAKDWLDRSTLSWDVFRETYPDLTETKEPAAHDGAPGDGGAVTPNANGGAKNEPGQKNADAIGSRPLELDAYEAIANFKSADRAYGRLEKLRASGAIDQTVLDEQAEKLSLARIRLLRAAEKVQLDVEVATANLESAERAYRRAEKLQASGAIEQAVLDEQIDKYNRAQIELDRAESKVHAFEHEQPALESLDRSAAGEGAADEPAETSSEQAPID